jgi:class 3 adenylate cyclase
LAARTILDVAAWLRELDLGQYAVPFAGQHIDGALLASLTDADLKEIGVASLGHRKRLLRAIEEIAGGTSPPAGGARADDGERRHVSVLFADLAGYTALTRDLGSEEMHALTQRFFAVADEAIVSHGGTIDKRIGDSVMAVFGAPIAHTDDPERAVRAAFAIRAAMPALDCGVGRTLAVHIGIAMGQVVASTIGTDHHRQYSVTGDSVNLAARLTSRASAGEILMSGDVRDALGARFESEPLGELEVKGFDRPVRAWRVAALRPDAPARATPFVGRSAELAHLARALEICRDAGRGMAIHVRGEAGIGKSRLLGEVARLAAERGFACHAGTVLDFGAGAERDAIRDIARSLAGRRTLGEGSERVFINDILGFAQPPELCPLADAMDHATRQKGRLAALASLVAIASAAQPALLLVEDVHWADECTLDHLARLCATVADCRALLVMTSRIEGDPLGAAWRSRASVAGLLTIDLGPLRDDDAAALAAGLIAPSSPLARRCIDRANGNPLFLEQLLRHAADPGDAEVPGTVQSVVLARADKLAAADRRALQAAAVLGQRFALAALRHLLGDHGYSPEALIEHVLLRPDAEELLFTHALIRDGIYSSLLRPTARAFHLAAASWYRDRELTLHAEHLQRAQDASAPRAYAAAAFAEIKAYRPHAALDLVRRGLACARARADAHALTVIEAEVLLDINDVAGSIEASGKALALADTHRERCIAHIGLAAGMRMIDRFADAFTSLAEAEREAIADELSEELARIHLLRGNLYFPKGRFEECRAEHERARVCSAETGSVELEARALSGLGDVEYMRGRYRTAGEHFAACLALCGRHGLGKIEVANRGMLAITRWFAGESALPEANAGIEAGRRVGNARGELIAHHGKLMALIGLLELEEARASVDRARCLAQQLGAMRFEAENLWFLATIERLAGDRATAAVLLREALTLARKTSIGFFGASILGSLALCTDDAEERAAALAEAEELLESGSVSHNHFFFARDAIDAALSERDFERALRYAQRLERYTAAEPLPWSMLVVERAEALVACGRGARNAALEATVERLLGTARQLGQLDLAGALEGARAIPAALGAARA